MTERHLTSRALRLLGAGVAHLQGEALFAELTRNLAELLDVDAALIGVLVGSATKSLRTTGLFVDGAHVPDVEFLLEGTPCGAAIGHELAVFPSGLAGRFPTMALVRELHAESYAGIALVDSQGRTIGSLGVFARTPLRHPERVEAMLRLFAGRAAAEIERRRSEAKFHDLFELSPDAELLVDEAGCVVLANRRAETLFGYPREELLGMSVDQLIPEGRRRTHAVHRRDFVAGSPSRLMGTREVLHAQRKDGTVFPVDVALGPMRSESGTIVVAAVRDVTERVRAEAQKQALEAQLRHAQKMEALGTLAGGIAHDFNNLLTAILANVQLARVDQRVGRPVAESLEGIEVASARAADLVRQILAFSRRQPPRRAQTSLATVVREVERLLRASIPAGVSIELAIAPDVPDVFADASQIHQVLMNLATNAWHALAAGPGTVTLALDSLEVDSQREPVDPRLPSGHYARLQVIDDGCGMSPATMERIFEPFFTTKGVGEGSGLGLSVVHGIVREHGGVTTVRSSLGRGTAFSVLLPAAPSSSTSARAADEAPTSGEGRVLYLDDEKALVRAATRILERLGYVVTPFGSPAEALAAIRRDPERFDVVVTDFSMPGMSGLEVAREIRRIRRDLPVAMVSGHAEGPECDVAGAGIRHRLTKPFGIGELAELLRRVRTDPPSEEVH